MDSRLEEIMFRMSKIISKIATRVAKLEEMAHPSRDFVTCEDCNQKIREKTNGKKG